MSEEVRFFQRKPRSRN